MIKVIIGYTHYVNNYVNSSYKKTVIRCFENADHLTEENVQKAIKERTQSEKSFNEVTSIELVR